MENRQLFGIIGSLLLFVGVFASIVSVPIMGNINYFQNGKGDGSFILILDAVFFIIPAIRFYQSQAFSHIEPLDNFIMEGRHEPLLRYIIQSART